MCDQKQSACATLATERAITAPMSDRFMCTSGLEPSSRRLRAPGPETLRTLRYHQDGDDDHDRDDRRGRIAAELHAALCVRLVQEIAHGGAEGPRQDERRPEQQRMRDARVEVADADDRQSR